MRERRPGSKKVNARIIEIVQESESLEQEFGEGTIIGIEAV